MIKLRMHVDINRAIAKLGKVPEIVQEKAAAAAINKTVAKAKTEMVRQITREYAVKASDVRPQLNVSKASWKSGKMTGTLHAFAVHKGHRSRNVILFDAKAVQGTGAPKRINVHFPDGKWRTITVREGGGVSVKIKRNGGRRLIKGAFIGNKGRTVFIRTGDGRQIKPVETLDIPQMFNTRKINEAVIQRVRAEFPVEMQRALKLYMPK
ncbi:hypothetical protein GALL_71570 [mine drainage metagenome]|uniref:Prophage minor tail protein Z (GPZ) n=1 Tax=mine drainage metagenome TaxID=410659 RepID=A0A1J5SR41_9ZZZZ